jgi:acyl carrier protein
VIVSVGDHGAATRSELTRELIGLFEDLIEVNGVNDDSDFFDIGGDSIIAARLIAHVRRRFGIKVPLRDLFDHRTPAAFAGAVADRLAAARS